MSDELDFWYVHLTLLDVTVLRNTTTETSFFRSSFPVITIALIKTPLSSNATTLTVRLVFEILNVTAGLCDLILAAMPRQISTKFSRCMTAAASKGVVLNV
jgi:hypothetical protein